MGSNKAGPAGHKDTARPVGIAIWARSGHAALSPEETGADPFAGGAVGTALGSWAW